MMSFFQGFAEMIVNFGGWFLPFSVVKQYEGGVLLRFGKYKRTLEPGLVWHWPFNIDTILKINVVFDSAKLIPQVLTTLDGISVIVGVSLAYRITDVKTFLLEVEDSDTVVGDASSGVLQAQVKATSWADVQQIAFQEQVFKAIRKRGFRFGVTMDSVFFTDLARTSLRDGVILHKG